MKTVEINAPKFFELLKMRDVSMWQIFSEMMKQGTAEIIFVDDAGLPLFSYTLPENLEKLEADRKIFAKEFQEKLNQHREN